MNGSTEPSAEHDKREGSLVALAILALAVGAFAGIVAVAYNRLLLEFGNANFLRGRGYLPHPLRAPDQIRGSESTSPCGRGRAPTGELRVVEKVRAATCAPLP